MVFVINKKFLKWWFFRQTFFAAQSIVLYVAFMPNNTIKFMLNILLSLRHSTVSSYMLWYVLGLDPFRFRKCDMPFDYTYFFNVIHVKVLLSKGLLNEIE